ncbi:MAG: hypothetical protein JWN46_897 [Acidimicrobiales bacterium]|nr:hypothetical protein [Acidimicrobiales bacterium]
MPPDIPGVAIPPPRPTGNRTVLVVVGVVLLVVLAAAVGAVVASSGKNASSSKDASQIKTTQDKKPPRVLPPPTTVPIPGPQPSAPVTTTTTTPETTTTTPSTGGGNGVNLGHGISATLPAGWKLTSSGPSWAYLSGGGAVFDLTYYALQLHEGAASVLQRHVQGAMHAYLQLKVTGVTTAKAPSAHVIEAIQARGDSVVASSSGGTFPVTSLFFVFVRTDSTAIVVEMSYESGTFGKHQADVQAIFDQVQNTV